MNKIETNNLNLDNIEDSLREYIGNFGLKFFYPQFEILRTSRNLPKDIDDVKLSTEKFYLSLNLLREWLAPVSELIQQITEEDLEKLQKLQLQAKAIIDLNSIVSWKGAMKHTEVKSILDEIKELKDNIVDLQQRVLIGTQRDNLINLLGLLIYPFAADLDLNNAISKASKYFGPNIYYKKQDIYTDALITMMIAERLFRKQRGFVATKKTLENKVDKALKDSWHLESDSDEWEKYRISHGKDGKFSERQIELLLKKMLGMKRLTAEIRTELLPYYSQAEDRYRISDIMDWLISKQSEILPDFKKEKIASEDSSSKFRRHTNFLLGLAFMDNHKNHEIAGNIPETSVNLFEKVLQPFNELKQTEIFMQSAQFSIESFGLPEQAWIYDYTGIKSEILRSTLLLISDRQPKFDVLEACQRFSSSVLGGRVDRNDIRDGMFTYTDQMPNATWNYICEKLVGILEETLVHEESKAIKIIKEIFAEEDRSQLVTSKKFVPVLHVDLRKDMKSGEYNEISIFKRQNFELQYRHVQAAGYPWFLNLNSLLEDLVSDALNIRDARKLESKVNLKQVVFKVEEEALIVIYKPQERGLTTLVFKEVDIGEDEDAITAVEILYRPRMFLDKEPEKNNLIPVLKNMRASDPKDLQTIVSNL